MKLIIGAITIAAAMYYLFQNYYIHHMYWWITTIFILLYFVTLRMSRKPNIEGYPTPSWITYINIVSIIGLILAALFAFQVSLYEPLPIILMIIVLYKYKIKWNEAILNHVGEDMSRDIEWKAPHNEDEMRALLKMSPEKRRSIMDEAITNIVVRKLSCHYIDETLDCLPKNERDLFMMTYAIYLRWLVKHLMNDRFPRDAWQRVESLIDLEYSKKKWHRRDVAQKLWKAMAENPPMGGPGFYTGMNSGPWPDVIVAAGIAGYDLGINFSPSFLIHVMDLKSEFDARLSSIAKYSDLQEP